MQYISQILHVWLHCFPGPLPTATAGTVAFIHIMKNNSQENLLNLAVSKHTEPNSGMSLLAIQLALKNEHRQKQTDQALNDLH